MMRYRRSTTLSPFFCLTKSLIWTSFQIIGSTHNSSTISLWRHSSMSSHSSNVPPGRQKKSPFLSLHKNIFQSGCMMTHLALICIRTIVIKQTDFLFDTIYHCFFVGKRSESFWSVFFAVARFSYTTKRKWGFGSGWIVDKYHPSV